MVKDKAKKVLRFLLRIFWIFVIGSIFGFFAEMMYALVYTRMLEVRQGLIYGPFIQVYGIGAVAYYLLISNMKDTKKVFFAGMILGGILEYLCSFFQEVFFGSISWDYSNLFLNINGRTSIQYCFYWGIIGVLYLKLIYPGFKKMDKLLNEKWIKVASVFMILFMTFDISISCMATDRQMRRHNNEPAKNQIDQMLDRVYPDEYLDRIYNNKKEVKDLE